MGNMSVLALLLQPHEDVGRVEQIAQTFGVDWPHLTAQLVSFAIVCAALYWFAYRPVLRMLESRRQQIALGLANTEKINAALAGIEAQRQSVMAEAQAQSTKLIAEAREIAKRLQEQEAQRSIASAEQILQKAREAAEQEHARMLSELRREVGRLVIQTTTAVVGKVLTPDDERRLAEETARQLTTT
jgi:F-type H+-transporting ATPase subunit b